MSKCIVCNTNETDNVPAACDECIGSHKSVAKYRCTICNTPKETLDGECACAGSKRHIYEKPPGEIYGRSDARDLAAELRSSTQLGSAMAGHRPLDEMTGQSELFPTSALGLQVGGDHYKKLPIQPCEYVHQNSIPYLEGSIIYYVTRWRDKNGIADLKKARHTLDLIIEMEERK